MSFDDLDIAQLRKRRGEKWQRYPDDVIPAWVADMDFRVAEPIEQYLKEALLETDIGYPNNPTAAGLPSVFARRAQERWGWKVDPRRVEVLTDVVQGMYIGLWVLSEAGEAAIIQTPVYTPFIDCVEEVGRRQITNQLVRGDKAYEIDFEALRKSIDPRTRVLMLCNPQNPTGRVFRRDELEQLAEIAIEHDLYVISDEIHSDLVFAGSEHIPIASLRPEIEARTLTLTSATKAFNIAGLRTAVAVFGSEALMTRFNSLPRHIRGGLGMLGLHATEIAWTQCDEWLNSVLAYLDGNRNFIEDFVRERMPGIGFQRPEATYLGWLDCRELGLPGDPYEFFLKQARVGLSSGPRFGPGGEGFVRVNFATSRVILTEVLERMAKSIS